MDIIDSRDLHDKLTELTDLKENLDELQDEIQSLECDIEDEDLSDDEVDDLRERLEEMTTECCDLAEKYDQEADSDLNELTTMENEVSEWDDGATLIAEEYWVEYVEDMLKDCGDLPQDIPHYIAIDWEQTAENIKEDYSYVEYQGTTYFYRCC